MLNIVYSISSASFTKPVRVPLYWNTCERGVFEHLTVLRVMHVLSARTHAQKVAKKLAGDAI